MNKEYCIGIDIGGSHIKMAILDSKNEIIDFEEVYLNKEDKVSKKSVIDFIESNIIYMKNELSKRLGEEVFRNIYLVGVSSPGIIKDGIIKNAKNLNIDEYNISKFLKESFNINNIVVINDGLAGTYGEKELGTLKDVKDGVFLTIGTGIGGEVILNGEVLKTSTNIGFELGHTIIELNGRKCSCGKYGCFEQYCSMRVLREYINNVLKQEKHLDLDKILNEEYLNKNDIENIEVKKVINRYIEDLADGIVSICEIFNPQLICISGSFSKFAYLFTLLRDELKNKKTVTDNNAEIKAGLLQNDANIYGAVIYGKVKDV